MPNKYGYFICELCKANHIRADNTSRHCLFHGHDGSECCKGHYLKEWLNIQNQHEEAEIGKHTGNLQVSTIEYFQSHSVKHQQVAFIQQKDQSTLTSKYEVFSIDQALQQKTTFGKQSSQRANQDQVPLTTKQKALILKEALENLRINTDVTMEQFIKAKLGLVPVKKIQYLEQQKNYPNKALFSEEQSQQWHKNDKFCLGVQIQYSDFGTTFRLFSLLFNDANSEQLLLIVRTFIKFCEKKGWKISKGRPVGEAKNITITRELYQEILDEFNEEAKDDSAARLVQTKFPFQMQKKTADVGIQMEEVLMNDIDECEACEGCQINEGFSQLNIASTKNDSVTTLSQILKKRNKEIRQLTYQEKVALMLQQNDGININNVSSVSVSSGGGRDGNTEEVNESLFDELSLGDIKTEELTDAQSFALKRLVSENKALQEKNTEYSLLLLNKRI